ncbi:MAG: porin [Gammaproteobacteria bacterium]|nr:porin [Gammaproteobacteria bacterium]
MRFAFQKSAFAALVSVAINTPLFADNGHIHGHDAFASKGEEHTHGTETGNVRTGDNAIEIYGKLYMALGYSDAGAGVPETIMLSSHGSILGVRGNQQLNESARLFWQIESGVDLDNMGGGGHEAGGNTSSFGGSDSFVGISGNAGTVLFGKHNTPLTMLVHSNDPFAHIAGDARSILGHASHHYESAFDPDHGTLFYVEAIRRCRCLAVLPHCLLRSA